MSTNTPGQIGLDPKAAFGKEEQEEQEEQKVEETKEEQLILSEDPIQRLQQVAELLKEQHHDAPSKEKLAEWKQNHGDIFILPVGEKTYIYRYLKRIEWIKMQTEEQFASMNTLQTEEYVFDKCILWPQIPALQKASLPAGLISTLSEQIRINSMFLNPEALAQMTIKL